MTTKIKPKRINSTALLIAVARDMERDLIVSTIRACAMEDREQENADAERAIRDTLRELADKIERGEIARDDL